MNEKLLYVLAGYDSAAEKRISDIQNKLYDKGFFGFHTKNIPQHITLGSFPSENEHELTHTLKRLSASVRAFDVIFSHIGIFSGGKVLFVSPDCSRNLAELKENFGSSFGWAPHSTLLIDEPENIIKAVPEVLREFSSFTGKIESLHLYEFFPARHIISVNLVTE